jgi:ATP/maltotriose-dependent transcriptional regulator MalT/two-component SAPR family response regulator
MIGLEIPILLYTKFLVPQRRPDAISREHLTERLRASLDRRLILISAPPGYGKTTLLAEFAARAASTGAPLLWYQLDQADSDPAVFLAYLTEGLRQIMSAAPHDVGQSFGAAARALINSADPHPPERILTVLINELAQTLAQDLIIVLEDYHLVTNSTVHTLTDMLIECAPPGLHLIISARSDPPLALARLRARGMLAELRVPDLRLAPDEVAALLGRIAPKLPSESAHLLSDKTEGWVAGVQLALSSVSGKDEHKAQQLISELGGTNRSIFEYLAGESFQQQPPEIQSFLLRTSVLAQMNAATCNAILNVADSQAMLERIEQGNLFLLSLDEKREWYRYHNLYRDFLRTRFYRQDPQAAQEMERAAGDYYESVGEREVAASHYMEAGDLASAAHVIADMAPTYLDSGRVQVLNHLLGALPSSELRSHPLLLIYHGAVLRRLGRVNAAQVRFVEARAAFATLGQMSGVCRALVELSETARSQGDYRRAQGLAAEALSYVDSDRHDDRARALMTLASSAGFLQGTDRGRALAEEAVREMELAGSAIAPTQRAGLLWDLGKICWWHGDPQAAVARCREALRILPDELSPIAAGSFISLVTPFLYWGELDVALDYAQKGLELATKLQLRELLPAAYSALGNVLTRRNQYVKAEELFRQAIELSRGLGLESYAQVMASCDLAFNLCQQSRVDEARQVAEAALWAHTESADTYEVCVCRSVLADVWLDAGQLEPAERLYESMLELEERRQFRIPLAMVYFGLAYIYLQTGRRAAGVEMVRKSLDLIAPTNAYQLYLDQGQRALVICRAAQAARLHPEFVSRVLAAMGPYATSAPQPIIEVRCLGPLRVFQHGVEITQEQWVSAKARELLAYFVTFRRDRVPLDRAIEALWPDIGPGKGKMAFHTALYRLRHALQAPERASKFIIAEAGEYRLDGECFSVDVDDFDRCIGEARAASGDKSIRWHEQAVSLYAGEYLDNLYYDWCRPERDRLREACLGALRALVAHYATADPQRAIAFGQRAIAIDPLLEDVHLEMMRCYHRLNDRAAVARQYRRLEQVLRDHLGIEPNEAAQALYSELGAT